MKGPLVIRADASSSIGVGHVMRCLSLARYWADTIGEVFFVGSVDHDGLLERFRTNVVSLSRLEAADGGPDDLAETLSHLERRQAQWLVLDGYQFDEGYHRALRQAGCKLLVIDDYNHLSRYDCDILLNQNISSAALRYRLGPSTRSLFGCDYVLLRHEIASLSRENETGGKEKRLLVTLGGSSVTSTLVKIVKALSPFDDLVQCDVLLTGEAQSDAAFVSAIAGRQNVCLHREFTALPGLMAQCDYAVSASGTTAWELAYLGVPTLLIVLAENQEHIARGLDEAGAAVNLGLDDDHLPERLRTGLDSFLRNEEICHTLSARARTLVDGRGVARVCTAMVSYDEACAGT